MAQLPLQPDGRLTKIAAGTYVTAPQFGFMSGLQLTIPDGWTIGETDLFELALIPNDSPLDGLFLWNDMVAVVDNDREGTLGQPLPGIGKTKQDLVAWLTGNTDFEIVEQPHDTTVGNGITGTQLALTVSATADFGADCPIPKRCAAIVTNPIWGPNFFGLGGDEQARFFISDLTDGKTKTFLIALSAESADDLAALAARAQPIIDSLRVPERYAAP